MNTLPSNLRELQNLLKLKNKKPENGILKLGEGFFAKEEAGKLVFFADEDRGAFSQTEAQKALEKLCLGEPQSYVDFLITKHCLQEAFDFIEEKDGWFPKVADGEEEGAEESAADDEKRNRVQKQLKQQLNEKLFDTIKGALQDGKKIPGVELVDNVALKIQLDKIKTDTLAKCDVTLERLSAKPKGQGHDLIKYAEDIGKTEDLVNKIATIIAVKLDEKGNDQDTIGEFKFNRLDNSGKSKECKISGNKEGIEVHFGDGITVSAVSAKDLTGKDYQERFKLIKQAIEERIGKTESKFLSLAEGVEGKIEEKYKDLGEDRKRYEKLQQPSNSQSGSSGYRDSQNSGGGENEPSNSQSGSSSYRDSQNSGGGENGLILKKPGINYEKAAWNIAGVASFVGAIVLAAIGAAPVLIPVLLICAVASLFKTSSAHDNKIEEIKMENEYRTKEFNANAKGKQNEIQHQQPNDNKDILRKPNKSSGKSRER